MKRIRRYRYIYVDSRAQQTIENIEGSFHEIFRSDKKMNRSTVPREVTKERSNM